MELVYHAHLIVLHAHHQTNVSYVKTDSNSNMDLVHQFAIPEHTLKMEIALNVLANALLAKIKTHV